MPVEYAGSTQVGARLIRYTVKPKPGQTAADRVLHQAGQHCRPETAEREFAMTRRVHGTQGATRKAPARYELPEPSETAAYVRDARPNGRRYWRPARDGEAATHVRREGEVVRQAEARHLITSFALGEVNPEDPEQVAQAFAYVRDRHAALYPGEQATFVGQAEGKGRKFHVHIVRNATLFADMEVDGKLYKAGSKLAGDLTDIDRMRERADAWHAAHHHEYGLPPQSLPSVSEKKKERRNSRDRRMSKQGGLSNHDLVRATFEESMDDPRSVDLDAFVEVMGEHGVEVKHRSSKRGDALSYWVEPMGTHNTGAKKYVRGATLGDHYAYEATVQQLAANAAGQPRERRPEPVEELPPRPVAVPTADELAEARETMRLLAAREHEERITDIMERCFLAATAVDPEAAFEAYQNREAGVLVLLAKEHAEKVDAERAAKRQRPAPAPPRPSRPAPKPEPAVKPEPAPVPTPAAPPKASVPELVIDHAEIEALMEGILTDDQREFLVRAGHREAEPAPSEAPAEAEIVSAPGDAGPETDVPEAEAAPADPGADGAEESAIRPFEERGSRPAGAGATADAATRKRREVHLAAARRDKEASERTRKALVDGAAGAVQGGRDRDSLEK